MSIEITAANVGTTNAAKLLKRLAEPIRQWATRWAWRGRAKRQGKVIPLLLMAFALSGCAHIQDALIVADEKAFGGGQNPGIGRVPDGHIIIKYPKDLQGNRVYTEGWTWGWEMVRKEGYVEPPFTLSDAKAKTDLQLLFEMISAKAESGDSGAADAQKLMLDAAKEAGIE
jgi:hypothetical protein